MHVVATIDWNNLASGTQQSTREHPAQLAQTDDGHCFHAARGVYSTPLV
jgi:hypothetical protein